MGLPVFAEKQQLFGKENIELLRRVPCLLVKCDAKQLQLEWRVAVALSEDKVGIQEILNKEDIHGNNQKAFVLPSRLIAKKYLFR